MEGKHTRRLFKKLLQRLTYADSIDLITYGSSLKLRLNFGNTVNALLQEDDYRRLADIVRGATHYTGGGHYMTYPDDALEKKLYHEMHGQHQRRLEFRD